MNGISPGGGPTLDMYRAHRSNETVSHILPQNDQHPHSLWPSIGTYQRRLEVASVPDDQTRRGLRSMIQQPYPICDIDQSTSQTRMTERTDNVEFTGLNIREVRECMSE
jgi:hypothetical protein